MVELVDPEIIETIVGAPRQQSIHLGKAVTENQMFYILHSVECVESGVDLRECRYSQTLAQYGVDIFTWSMYLDRTVLLGIDAHGLVPLTPPPLS